MNYFFPLADCQRYAYSKSSTRWPKSVGCTMHKTIVYMIVYGYLCSSWVRSSFCSLPASAVFSSTSATFRFFSTCTTNLSQSWILNWFLDMLLVHMDEPKETQEKTTLTNLSKHHYYLPYYNWVWTRATTETRETLNVSLFYKRCYFLFLWLNYLYD